MVRDGYNRYMKPKKLEQSEIEEIVAEQIDSAMDWEFFIFSAILILPVLILTLGGIYATMPILLKLGFWFVLYMAYYKTQKWVVARKVRHTIEQMREASQ